ncbi:hypothetical protein [Methylomonas sp. MgM2]
MSVSFLRIAEFRANYFKYLNNICFQEKTGLILLIWLFIFNYGKFWTRGGYADDFAFLSFISDKTLIEAITQWSFNSRFTQAILFPLIFKPIFLIGPGDFQWWFIQLLGLICFTIIMFFLNKILLLANIEWPIRFFSLFLFSIYPLKCTTILWPAAIIGYIFPLLFLVLGCFIYLRDANRRIEKQGSRVIVFTLFLLSAFGIEQLIPIIVLIFTFRCFAFPISKKTLIIDFTGLISILGAFVFLNFYGASRGRVERHTHSDFSILNHSLDTFIESLSLFIKYPLSIVLDQYYRDDLIETAKQASFQASELILFILAIYCYFLPKIRYRNNKYYSVILSGLLIWLAAFSPLMVIDYYLPDRVFLIPLIGMSIAFGATIALIINQGRLIKLITIVFLFLTCTLFNLVNNYIQNDFEENWQASSLVIHTLGKHRNEIYDNSTVRIFNLPNAQSPSPKAKNAFSVNGITHWLFPNKHVSGDSLASIDSVFMLPNTIQNTSFPFNVPNIRPNDINFIYADEKVLPLKGIILISKPIKNHNTVDHILTARVNQIDLKGSVENYRVIVPYYLNIESIDIILVKIIIQSDENRLNKGQLRIHATDDDDLITPYDIRFDNNSEEWTLDGNKLFSTVIINHASKVRYISIFTDRSKQKLSFELDL